MPRTERVFMTWTIHHSCNYRCSYCFITTGYRDIFMDNTYPGLEKWKAVWDRMYSLYGSCIIKIAGGEPFTYPDFMELVGHLTQKHFLDFSSNLSWDVDEFCRRAPKDSARIEPSYHPEFYPDRADFARKCLTLKKHGFMGSVHMVGFPTLVDAVVEAKAYFETQGLNSVILPFRGKHNDVEYPNGYTEEQKRKLEAAIGKAPEKKPEPAAPAAPIAAPEPAPAPAALAQAVAAPGGNALPEAARDGSLPLAEANGHAAGEAPPPPEDEDPNLDPEEKARRHIRRINERYFNWYVKKENRMEDQGSRWCLLGAYYGKIQPNGDVLRCCTPVAPERRPDLLIGNILDPEFRLLEGAKECDISPCHCWKPMLFGQEAQWKPLWRFETYGRPDQSAGK